MRMEPRGVKSDEIPALWEETLPPIKVVLARFETGNAVHIGVVTAGVWRPNSLDESKPASGIKEVPGGRVGRPQKYPTHLWFTIPTGRGKRLKPVLVSVRIRSELPKFEIFVNLVYNIFTK